MADELSVSLALERLRFEEETRKKKEGEKEVLERSLLPSEVGSGSTRTFHRFYWCVGSTWDASKREGFRANAAIFVPSESFREKDYLDDRYCRTRRKIFDALKEGKVEVRSAVGAGCGSRGRSLHVSTDVSSIRVVLQPQEGCFDANKARLRPPKDLPKRWDVPSDPSWPRCRSAIACDMATKRRFDAEEKALKKVGDLAKHSSILVELWAERCGACEGRDAVSLDVIRREAIRTALKYASTGPTVLQVVRETLRSLSRRAKSMDMDKKRVENEPRIESIMPSRDQGKRIGILGESDTVDDWMEDLKPCDCASPSAVQYAGYLADCSQALLDSKLASKHPVEVVDAAFGDKAVDRSSRFDLLLRIRLPEHDTRTSNGIQNMAVPPDVHDELVQEALDDEDDSLGKDEGEEGLCDEEETPENLLYDQGVSRAAEEAVENALRVAMGKRAIVVRAIGRDYLHHRKGAITVGMVLDPSHAFARVEMGPKSSQTEEAAAFRARHGSRASLRRFANGMICEAVVWAQRECDRHKCPSRIAKAAIRRAFPGARCAAVGSALDGVLSPSFLTGTKRGGSEAMKEKQNESTDPREVARVGDQLAHVLRKLDGLPLRISGVLMLPPSVHVLKPFPVEKHVMLGQRSWYAIGKKRGRDSRQDVGTEKDEKDTLPLCVDPVEVHVVLEGSGRWPSDPEAAAKARSAFLLQIAEHLSSDMGIDSISSETCVDVLYEGFAFRLTLDSQDGVEMNGGAEASDFRKRNAHYSAMAVLVDKHPEFAPTVRLAKRWFAGHMLSSHIQDEAVELLVASLFTRPYICNPPATRFSGFCRFLELLCTHPWNSQPLVVDVSSDLSKTDLDSAMASFDSARHANSGPSMCLMVSYCMKGDSWTSANPCKEVLQRIRELARMSHERIKDMTKTSETSEVKWKSIFVSSLTCNDVVLLLRPEALKAPHQSICKAAMLLPAEERTGCLKQDFPPPRKQARAAMHIRSSRLLNCSKEDALGALLIGFDPVKKYVSILRESFGSFCHVFFDEYGGDAIGIKWKAKAFLVDYKEAHGDHVNESVTGQQSIAPDIPSILRNMVALGEGLLKNVVVL